MPQTVEILVGECSLYLHYLVQSLLLFDVGTASPHIFVRTTPMYMTQYTFLYTQQYKRIISLILLNISKFDCPKVLRFCPNCYKSGMPLLTLHPISYSISSQTFAGHVPLQYFGRWACTPKTSYDKKAEKNNKNMFTNKHIKIFDDNIHW